MKEFEKASILSSLVEIEAKRAKIEAALKPNPDLLADGWERRFITDANRAPELIELYHELGFEILSEDVDPKEFNEACKDCGLMTLIPLKTLYTRKPN